MFEQQEGVFQVYPLFGLNMSYEWFKTLFPVEIIQAQVSLKQTLMCIIPQCLTV